MGATLILLAEISDKMPSIPEIWFWLAVPTLVLAAVALTDRWTAVFTVPFAIALSIFFAWVTYHEAYLEGSFSNAVWTELGAMWVANSFAASLLPAVVVVVITALKWRRHQRRQSTGADALTL